MNLRSTADEASGDWRSDRWLWAALAVALVLRVLPLIVWEQGYCARDECIYRSLANGIFEGEGLKLTQKGWLPAPGYPYLLAFMRFTTTVPFTVKGVQVVMALLSVALIWRIAERIDGRRTARVAAMLYAVHPTLAFFTNTMWIETIFIFFVLCGVLGVFWAREGPWPRAALVGLSLGCAALFKGVGTYFAPLFMLALVWPEGPISFAGFRDGIQGRAKHAIALFFGFSVAVAPYSIHASAKHGGFMVVDATIGHVMWLGNNEYAPLTFDYGNGMLTGPLYSRYLRSGRPACDRTQPVVQSSACDRDAAIAWAKANPSRFMSRMPMRMAQFFNPNTFLTRHIRWGYWVGLPWWLKETFVLYIVASSVFVTAVGTVGAWSRARGPFVPMAVGIVLYTCFAAAVSYGMSRFRLPLEPLWIVFAAMVVTDPRRIAEELRASTWRTAGILLTLPALLALMAWYLPTGFPRFW